MIITTMEFLPSINMKVEIGKGNQIIVFGKTRNEMTDEIFEYVINGKIIYRKLPSKEEHQKNVICFEIGRVLSNPDEHVYVYGGWLVDLLPCLLSFDQSLVSRLKIYKNTESKFETARKSDQEKNISAASGKTTVAEEDDGHYPETTCRSTGSKVVRKPVREESSEYQYPETTRKSTLDERKQRGNNYLKKNPTKDSNQDYKTKVVEKDKKAVAVPNMDNFIQAVKETLGLELDYSDAICLFSIRKEIAGYSDIKNREEYFKKNINDNFSKETAQVLLKNKHYFLPK